MKKNITKLLLGTITEKEIIELRDWLKDEKNQTILESYVRDNHDLNLATLENNLDDAYNKVTHEIDINTKPVKKLFPLWTKFAAAAAIALLIGLGFYFQQNTSTNHGQCCKAPLVPEDEPITLELDNGTIQTIDITGKKEVRDSDGNIIGAQEQNQISYSHAVQKEDLVFNTLKIPHGKKFQLVLSDSTIVHLNAGSSLRYPVAFLTEGPREVFLTGEAYFDVTKNVSNPFVVNVNELDVKVLGTQFNVSAYDEDKNIDVVLVEGAVSLDNKKELEDAVVTLTPGQKGSFDYASKGILVNKVNTSQYTSWMQGHLVFRNLTFNQILAKLERHYNIELENSNIALGKEIFNASFNDVKIDEVLSYFNDTHEIDYTIQENKVIIK